MLKHGSTRATNICREGVRALALATASIALVCALSGRVWAQPSAKPLVTLTHAEQIRRLSPEQAALGYPVRVRGVITMDAPAPDFFIQDATAGIYAEGSVSPKYAHLLGQLVEVEGITGPGKFAPVIRERRLRVLGKGVLPKAQLFPFSELADGREDSQGRECGASCGPWASTATRGARRPSLCV